MDALQHLHQLFLQHVHVPPHAFDILDRLNAVPLVPEIPDIDADVRAGDRMRDLVLRLALQADDLSEFFLSLQLDVATALGLGRERDPVDLGLY